jgi:hypothetical protein
MSSFAKTMTITVTAGLLAVLPASASASEDTESGIDPITCVPIPAVDYDGQTIYPGGKVCVPTP